jgi:rubrerythrin
MTEIDRDREASRGRLPALQGTLTLHKLRSAFVQDAGRRQLYGYLAQMADIEGHPETATLLRELAESSGLLADGHLDLLRRVGDPLTGLPMGSALQSLRALSAGLSGEVETELLGAAETAISEGFPDVASWFQSARALRAAHLARATAQADRLLETP